MLASLAFILLSSSYVYLHESRKVKAAADSEIRLIHESLSPAIEEALWDYDYGLVQILADSILTHPYVSYVLIEDTAGKQVESGRKTPGGMEGQQELVKLHDGRTETLGRLVLGMDEERIAAELRAQVFSALVIQVLFLVLQSLIILALFMNLVARPLEGLARAIRDFDIDSSPPLALDRKGRGDEFVVLVSSFNDMRQSASTSREAERKAAVELGKLLQEKEVLLQEVYHRTRNNMQLISAFLSMESAASGDAKLRRLVEDMNGRISAMALVHRKLYESQDLSRIGLADYLADLLGEIRQTRLAGRPGIELRLEVGEDLVCLLDTAIPFGLILNELVTNAILHGFPDAGTGSIDVSVTRKDPGVLELRVEDTGVGLPGGFQLERDGGIGLRTVSSLVEAQLQGSIEFRQSAGSGLSCRILVRDDLYGARV